MHMEARDHTSMWTPDKQMRFSKLPHYRKSRHYVVSTVLGIVAYTEGEF